MTSWQKKLAFKWCESYGDKEHHTCHHASGEYVGKWSMWCGNCRDGVGYIRDVVNQIKEMMG